MGSKESDTDHTKISGPPSGRQRDLSWNIQEIIDYRETSPPTNGDKPRSFLCFWFWRPLSWRAPQLEDKIQTLWHSSVFLGSGITLSQRTKGRSFEFAIIFYRETAIVYSHAVNGGRLPLANKDFLFPWKIFLLIPTPSLSGEETQKLWKRSCFPHFHELDLSPFDFKAAQIRSWNS